MRKVWLFIAGVLLYGSALASSELSLNPFYAWGDGMHVKDSVVTCDANKSWQGAQIWFDQDFSAYDYVWIEMDACDAPFQLSVEYADGTSSVNIESGDYVAYIALDATKKSSVQKIELKNRENGGNMTIAGVYAGTQAQWQSAMADFREALDFQYFDKWYDASWSAETKTLSMIANYGAGSWWSIGDKSDCHRAVVYFASATPAGGNLTVTYTDTETKSQQNFYEGATQVAVDLDGSLKSNVSQIYVQGGGAGSSYTFAEAYLMKTPTLPLLKREDATNLGTFKAYNDGLTVSGNTITFDSDQSWKGCDSWLGQDLSAYDYLWAEVAVEGSIKMSLQYGDNSTEEKVIGTGTPFVGFRLDDAQKSATNKLMLQNTTNGGTITVKHVFVGSEADYTAAQAVYLKEMDWSSFGNQWGTEVSGKTATMMQDWGAAGWWVGQDYSSYTKVLVEFATATPCAGNITVDYDGNDQNTSVGFDAGATYVELTMDERKTKVNRVRVSLATNGKSCTLRSVALVKDMSNVLALNENEDNTAAIAFRDGATCDVTLNRTFDADGYWYTLCLPFDLTAEQIAATLGECELMLLSESYMKSEEMLYLQFEEATTIQAGVPYLFKPAAYLSNLTFTEVTIDATAPTAYPTGSSQLATMTGTYSRPQLDDEKYVMTTENTLAPSDGTSWMRAFRAWFELNPSVANIPARCVFGRGIATDIEELSDGQSAIKQVENGELYILRDGIKYNVAGQIIQ